MASAICLFVGMVVGAAIGYVIEALLSANEEENIDE